MATLVIFFEIAPLSGATLPHSKGILECTDPLRLTRTWIFLVNMNLCCLNGNSIARNKKRGVKIALE